MKISIIVAKGSNRAIGKNQQLLWHLPEDMAFFKNTTTGHAILSGRKNYESIPSKFRPLKNRLNIILTHNKDYHAEGAKVVHQMEEAIRIAKAAGYQQLFIIGGGEIYKQTMKIADELLVTEVDDAPEADTFFPEIDPNTWTEVSRKKHDMDEKHAHSFDFVTYIRK